MLEDGGAEESEEMMVKREEAQRAAQAVCVCRRSFGARLFEPVRLE